MSFFTGIDMGSTTIKIALIDDHEHCVAHSVCPSGSHFHNNTREAYHTLLDRHRIRPDQVTAMVTTGYGRKLFKEADASISEITANAAGARRAGGEDHHIRTIINIGGQDLKVILLDDQGQVKDFAMNDKCAAGTGRFLEMTARNLEMEVDQLGDCHRRSQKVPLTINSTCTVFAESEIISLLAHGHGKEEVVAGIHYSIARRVARIAKRLGVQDTVLFDGGPALNPGLIEALETELMREVVVPKQPQITTALGAAVLARESFYDRREIANG
ncbi:MAG: CoA activase [Proteobacteria bacterium]|nr:CoA activase [Pseudomonadota bacterium]MBU1687437.1 CoA activase [Pseudomonadota bacterium]